MVLYKGGGELTGSAPGGDNNKILGLTGLKLIYLQRIFKL